MDTLTSLKVFRQIIESGSFVAAAQRLDLSTATVSKHLMSIERRLGVRLVNRNNRMLSLTEPGRVYLERCKTILDDLEATELQLGSLCRAPRGTLRMSCPTWFEGQRLAAHLAQFSERFPEIVVDVSFEDRCVDLVGEGYDLALRVTREAALAPGLIARPVRPVSFLIGASRQYLKRYGAPRSCEDLASHRTVAVGSASSWVFPDPHGQKEIPMRVAMRYRSVNGAARAVAAGIGIAALPDILFEDPLLKDVLVPILPEASLGERTLYIVYAGRRYVPQKLRTCIDFILDGATRLGLRTPGPMIEPAPALPRA